MANYDDGLRYAKTSSTGDASRQAFEKIFAKETARIVTVLAKTGDLDQARRIQAEALAVLDNPLIRDAVGP